MQKPTKSSLLSFILTMSVVILVVLYLVLSLNTYDMLWFLPTFKAEASAITVHCYGEDVEVVQGSEAFKKLNEVINDSISGRKRWDQLTLSDATLEEYLHSPKMMVLEVQYAQPERIHSIYRFYKNFSQLYIPLDARHSKINAVFGMLGDQVEAGSMIIHDNSAIIQAVEDSNLCKNQSIQ
jgi:hypothetical protein